MNGERKVSEADVNVQSTDAFLSDLGKRLRKQENADVELSEILANHLLSPAPAVDAVANAKAAIQRLANDRADRQRPETDDG